MARESKGQQVKTFKHFVPQEDVNEKYVEAIAKVYFDANSGNFGIWLPEHIARVVEALRRSEDDRNTNGFVSHEGVVRASTLERVKGFYTTILERYAALMKAQQREKVIRVYYSRNLSWHDGTVEHFRASRARETTHHGYMGYKGGSDIAFCGAPALHLNFDVLWKAGNSLYEECREHHLPGDPPPDPNAVPRLRYKEGVGEHGKSRFIAWTQEREDFFRAMRAKIEELIMRLDNFTDDLAGQTDLAIARMSMALALPAPAPALVHPVANSDDGPVIDHVPSSVPRARTRTNPPPVT